VYLILRLILDVSVAVSGRRNLKVSAAPKWLPITKRIRNHIRAFETISISCRAGPPEIITDTDHFSYLETQWPISGCPLPLAEPLWQQSYFPNKRHSTLGKIEMCCKLCSEQDSGKIFECPSTTVCKTMVAPRKCKVMLEILRAAMLQVSDLHWR
jgi:hypothetical protein